LTIPLLAAHLLAMNVASAGPLLAAWLRWRNDEFSAAAGRRLIAWSIYAFLFGMATGGLLIVTIPGNSLWAALQRFPAGAYWFAGGELLFSLSCMLLIAWGWRFSKWIIAAIAFVSATNLLYHFPPLMAVIGKLAANPKFTSAEVINRPLLLELMGRGEISALSLHFVCSAIAVSAIAILYLIFRDTPAEEQGYASVARGTAGTAFAATLMQVPVGVWLLISLPGTSRMALMGKSSGGSLAFMAAMVLSLILLQRLFALALGDVERKSLRAVVALTCIIVLLMTTSLRLSRFVLPQPAAASKTALSANAQGCCIRCS
jgi:hypothetical protein